MPPPFIAEVWAELTHQDAGLLNIPNTMFEAIAAVSWTVIGLDDLSTEIAVHKTDRPLGPLGKFEKINYDSLGFLLTLKKLDAAPCLGSVVLCQEGQYTEPYRQIKPVLAKIMGWTALAQDLATDGKPAFTIAQIELGSEATSALVTSLLGLELDS